MNKITKASIAAGAGVILLLGGGGTLAYWNASTDAGAAAITAGTLSVTPVALAVGTTGWTDGDDVAIDPATFKAVPGDVLTYTREITITASGDNLRFEIEATPGSFGASNALTAELERNASYSLVSGTGVITATSVADQYTVTSAGTTTATVEMTITWPFDSDDTNNVGGLDNDAKGLSASLGNTSFTLTQIANP